MKEIKIKVKGMHCSSCENRIKNNLEQLEEVEKVSASHTKEEVIIIIKKEINLNFLKEQIEDLGFEVIN